MEGAHHLLSPVFVLMGSRDLILLFEISKSTILRRASMPVRFSTSLPCGDSSA